MNSVHAETMGPVWRTYSPVYVALPVAAAQKSWWPMPNRKHGLRFDWAKYIDKNSNSVYMMYASDIVPSYTHTLV